MCADLFDRKIDRLQMSAESKLVCTIPNMFSGNITYKVNVFNPSVSPTINICLCKMIKYCPFVCPAFCMNNQVRTGIKRRFSRGEHF
jgi:hypothetical protein